MCVKESGFLWERPATIADCAVLSQHFPGVDFLGAFRAMSVYGFRPLPTDLVLVAGLFSSPPDKDGVRIVPFSGYDPIRKTIVKLSVMDNIVPWMENSALGTAMWRSVSEWTHRTRGTVIEFTMKCSCIEIPTAHLYSGAYGRWLERFHASRENAHGIFGRSRLPIRKTPRGTDITFAEWQVWKKMRYVLESLHTESSKEEVA